MAAATINERLEEMRRDTLGAWRSWAFAMADGGDRPSPLAVLEAGAVLGLRSPMEELERDVAAIEESRRLDAAADAEEKRVRQRLATWGGSAGLRERIRAAEREVAEMRRWLGPLAFGSVGSTRGRASDIRQKCSRVFPGGVAESKRPAPARRQRKVVPV